MNFLIISFFLLLSNLITCQENDKPQFTNVLIEIPMGSSEKWEFNKYYNQILQDSLNGLPRHIEYLNYPFNYGFVLNKFTSEDGDLLDAVVIGSKLEKGSVVEAKVISLLDTYDNGESDPKLILIHKSSRLYSVNSLKELNNEYNGVTDIVKIWFSNYKKGSIVNDYLTTLETLDYLH